jgi:uncharacterized repeat protein (TIGR01451 family)
LLILFAAVWALALPTASAFGEGSVNLNTGPAANYRHGLSVANPDGSGAGRSPLLVYAQPGETIQMASSLIGVGGNIRIFAPGADPATATALLNCALTQPATGRIASRAQELAGPLPNAGGYTTCDFTVPANGMAGIYTVIMYGASAANGDTQSVQNPNTTATQGYNASMWDVTVRAAGGAIRPGRAFSPRLQLRTSVDLATGSGVQAFVYTRTGYEYQVNFYQHAGLNWLFMSDDKGIVDSATGDRIFASFACGNDQPANNVCQYSHAKPPADIEPGSGVPVGAPSLATLHPLFFNRVDPLVISGPGGLSDTHGYSPTAISPSSNPLAGQTFTGAEGQSGATKRGAGGTIAFNSPAQMAGLDYTLEIDTDRDGTFGNGADVVTSDDLSSTGTNSFAWDGKDRAGNVPACGDYQYRIRATLAEVHFTQIDVENSGGTRIERLTLPDDPALGDPLAASYDNRDPYKGGYVVTNNPQAAVTDGISGPGFNAWDNNSGNTDYIDTWARLPEVQATGTLRLLCAEMQITKKASSSPAVPGSAITYDVVVKNNGPDTATNVTVSDPLPAGLTYLSSSPECAGSGQTVNCSFGSMAAGESRTVQVSASVDSGLTGGSLSNTATVSNDTPDPDPDNNTSTETVPVEPQADLQITKHLENAKVVPGRTAKYRLIITNNGPSPATNVRMTDTLPKGLTYVSSTPSGCTHTSGTITCSVAELASGASVSYEITTKVASSVKSRVVNVARVTSDTKDPDPDNNTDEGGPGPEPEADLSIDKVPSVSSVKVGEQLFYTLVVKNHGPSDAQDVVVTDTAMAGLTLLSAQTSQGGCKVTAIKVTCTAGTLVEGGTMQVLVSARADAVGTLVDKARVGSSTDDPNRKNNEDEEKVSSEPGSQDPAADLQMAKKAKTAKNGRVTYTLTVTNLGQGVATGVKVIDTPNRPIKIRSVKASQGSCKKAVPLTCTLGTLNPGAKAMITIVAQPLSTGKLRNTASVISEVPDPNDKNNIAGVSSTVRGKLAIRKTASRAGVRAGGTLRYTIKVTNRGRVAVSSVRVCDRLPSGLAYVSSSPRAGLVRGSRHCWTISRLAAGKSKTFKVTVRAGMGAFGRKVNTATASGRGVKTVRAKRAVTVTDPRAGVTG